MSSPALDYLKTKIELIEQRLVIQAARRHDKDSIQADRMATVLKQEVAEMEHRDELLGELPVTKLRLEHGLEPFEVDVLFLAVGAHLDSYLGELAANCYAHSNSHYISPWLAMSIFCERRSQRLEVIKYLEPGCRLMERGLISIHPHSNAGENPMYYEIVPAGFLSGFLRGRRVVGYEVGSVGRAFEPELGFDEIAIGAEDRRFLEEIMTYMQISRPELGITAHMPRYDFPKGMAMLLTSPRGSGKTLIARAFAKELGRDVIEIDCERLAAMPMDLSHTVLKAAFIEAAFCDECLILDQAELLFSKAQADQMSGLTGGESTSTATFNHCVHQYPALVVLTASTEQTDLSDRIEGSLAVQYHLSPMTNEGCGLAWQLNLPGHVSLAPDVDFGRLTELYTLSGRSIQNAINLASRRAPDGDGLVELDQRHLDLCARIQQNTTMSQVVKRTFIKRSRADLLLPPEIAPLIDELIETERIRESVLNDWDLASKFQKGLGLACLFDGDPGTGKTLTAEVIASELDMPMYTVNISYVVSKYIGETEKNLQRIFDEGSKGRSLLLFDEADTLFSKRTEVKNSVDRFSNMEIGLLLQLIEGYRGLVVLTTNLKSSIDSAFNRRFSYKIQFPMPDHAIRRQIWDRHLPKDHLARHIDIDKIAKEYELSGGSIRTISLRAAYRAALSGKGIITQRMLDELVREEMRSLGRLIRD